ncbi:MAG: Smr/MutS family protein [Chloroflexi bacterium]|nr:Smr/MutS family protein [Chloroflexota bacterium]
MDVRSARLLEYPLIRDRLAAATNFPPSRRLAEAMEPSSDAIIVRRLLDETDQTRAFLSGRPEVGVGGARDIGPAIGRADRGGRLDPGELLAIGETLVAASRLGDALRPVELPRLHELSRLIVALPAVRDRLLLSIDPSGEILDSASPALGGLRRAVRIAYERLRSRLEQLVHGSELGSALQEPIVTLRNGRYVIPVRADAKGRVKGIVHDQSGSGQTLFVEPLIAVELGNAWREAQLAATAEEERILDELSSLVALHAGQLRDTLDALARFDLWAARARLAEEMDAIRATESDGAIVLLSARHPGLSGRVVPIDITLGEEFRALVITGPNTGGKTVALRTVGLLCLMHQSGLHVPAAEGSRLPILQDVFADIGDEQSVAQSLSTFSGHLRSIVRIVEATGPGCLVLLDELGAGTDPTEGSALAQALLDRFIRLGALVVATTHYAELKVYAHETPEARNASVEFDLETLSPTYRLTIGLPGTSQAFAIAERLGLDQALVDDARGRLTRAQQDFERTLAAIKESQQEMDEARETARVAEARAVEARHAAEEERRRARAERAEAAATAREEAERAVAAIHEEIAQARALLARQTLTESRLDEAMARLEERLAAIPTATHGPETPPDPGTWQVGQRAATRSGWVGTISTIDAPKGRATLAVGQARTEVDIADLVSASAADAARLGAALPGRSARPERPGTGRRGELEPAVPPRSPAGRPARPGTSSGRTPERRVVPSTLDLRGARVDEALEMLESTLDRAATAGAGRITIVHGHGSGALRDAVRATLAKHPLVSDWRPGEKGEGGDGATIVTV